MVKQLKVTIRSMSVHNNGESAGKGELFWRFDIDGEKLVELPINNPRKTNDGELISLGESRIVSKNRNDTLDISGTISEKDWPSKDENVTFTQQFTEANGWGVGTHDVNRKDGKLDVTVHYEITNA
jgi:hypothetical protein